ncbi:MAG: hypothetical protein SFW65_06110 [Alphaproteobacteria bacterium]|nr:hypothetical protein [Alphaproteobacteria bacterium]
MHIFLRMCCCLLLLSISGCIGSRLHSYGGEGELQNGNTETDIELNRRLVGLTRDQLITLYGPPNRSISLDNGFKLMQYNRKTSYLLGKSKRSQYNCELRLWMLDKKVHHVDYRGDQHECLFFTSTGRQNVTHDLR